MRDTLPLRCPLLATHTAPPPTAMSVGAPVDASKRRTVPSALATHTVVIPALGGFGVVFGLWYAGLA